MPEELPTLKKFKRIRKDKQSAKKELMAKKI